MREAYSRLVLFDIDGTLLLTAGAGRRAITAALSDEVDDPAAFAGIRFDGKTDPQIVAEMLEAAGQAEERESERVRRLCARYVGLLAEELERPTTRMTVMPGVEPLLERLEPRADRMGSLAREAWNQFFSRQSIFHWLVEQCISISESRYLPEPLARRLILWRLACPRNLNRITRPLVGRQIRAYLAMARLIQPALNR